MVQGVRATQLRSTTTNGRLSDHLRTLSPSRQAAAAKGIQRWARAYFGTRAAAVTDDLLGVRRAVILHPAIAGNRTAGRSIRPGIPEALVAVEKRLALGSVGQRQACRDVAAVIHRYWDNERPSQPTCDELIQMRMVTLDRVLFDSRRRRARVKSVAE
jgi:hypothetical protein